MFKRSKAVIGATLAALMLMGDTSAFAFGLAGSARNLGQKTQREYIVASARTKAPFAHVIFCHENPEECSVTRSRRSRLVMALTEDRARELQQVNAAINRAIRPRNDLQKDGDVWTLAPRAGDCEDYAITKRHELISRGWSPRALRLAVTYTAFGEGHMVLVVKTSKGDVVLDNRNNAIRAWNKTGLKWVMIQSAANPRKWMTI